MAHIGPPSVSSFDTHDPQKVKIFHFVDCYSTIAFQSKAMDAPCYLIRNHVTGVILDMNNMQAVMDEMNNLRCSCHRTENKAQIKTTLYCIFCFSI